MGADFQFETDLRNPCVLANDQARVAWLARLGRQALIAEAELTPKPGLVDRRGAFRCGNIARAGWPLRPHGVSLA